MLFAVLAALCEVAAIGLFGRITDEVLTTRDLDAFWGPAFSWLALAVVAGLASLRRDVRHGRGRGALPAAAA